VAQHNKLLVALGLGIVGGLIGHIFVGNEALNFFNTHILNPVGQIFLRLIFMIVVPLIFSALVMGVYELAKVAGLGRVATRTIFYTLLASGLSVVVGIGLVNIIQPGSAIQLDEGIKASIAAQSGAIGTMQQNITETKSISQIIVELIPKNPIESASKALSGELVALMVFALIFGLAMTRVKTDVTGLLSFFEQIYAVSMKIMSFAMKIAPFGIFALVFNTVFKFGYEILFSLALYVLVVVLGLLIQQFVVYSILLRSIGKRSPWAFYKECGEVLLYAFSTASSNATLPKSLDVAENRLKLDPRISRFVLTIGATANQNGTALFEGVTVLFLAQVYGIHLDLAQQFQVVFMSMLAGVGTAGVPGGSLPLIMILVQSLGIPAEGMGLILGVDRFLDMARTTLNVSGDLVVAALVDSERTT
jgi:dicarboxylate/amino acid:cation (Na+ or H+) symporter, DAACS family